MFRGEIWWAALPEPQGKRPVLVLSRDKAIQVRDYVIVAMVTRTIRSIASEVLLSKEDGMPASCVVNLDVINTIPKKVLTDRVTVLNNKKLQDVHKALQFSLGLV